MPILEPQADNPEAKRQEAAERVPRVAKQMAKRQLQQMLKMQNNGIDFVWNHPVLQPQEVCDALGADAKEVFTAHGTLTQTIVGLATMLGVDVSSRIKVPTNNFTDNDDGTITVLDTPFTP